MLGRVLVLPGDFKYSPQNAQRFKSKFDVTIVERPLSKAELIEIVPNFEAILSRSHTKIDSEVLDAAKNLKIIARQGAGYDEVDARYAASKRIWVSNTPDVVSKATADLAMAHLLNITRRFSESERWLREGNFAGGWERFLGRDPGGRVLGILGMGGIGKELAKRAAGFDMKVVYHNRHRLDEESERRCGARYVSKDELLETSDYISVHVPATPETKHILSTRDFSKMKQGVFIINTSRGVTIDEQALVDALKSGRVAGAGLDVFEREPTIHPDLYAMPNVSMTPHTGTASWDTRKQMEDLAMANVESVLEGRAPLTPVAESKGMLGKL